MSSTIYRVPGNVSLIHGLVRPLTFLVAVIFVLLPAVAPAVDAAPRLQPESLDIANVTITDVRDVSFVVSWTTDVAADGIVEYGTSTALGVSKSDPVSGVTTHHVVLAALVPETTYYFRVRSGDTIDDHGGAFYQVNTGPSILTPPKSKFIWGKVYQADGSTPAAHAIVYMQIQDRDGVPSSGVSQWVSSLTDTNGDWFYSDLGNVRTEASTASFDFTDGVDGIRVIAQGGEFGTWGADPDVQTIPVPTTYPAQLADIVVQVPVPWRIVDNGDPGFTVVSGSWLVNPGGYGNDKHFKAAGTGTAVVRWSFDVEPGLYRVSATWTADRNRATDSPFTVYDGATAVATVDMNQELAPNDFTDAGVAWENVGWLYDIGTGRLVVELSDAANELVIADAIRIERAEPEPLQIVDDGDPGFAVVSGSWLVNPGGYGNDKRFKAAGTGAAVVRWSFDVQPGLYRVSATWTADRNRATDSPFTAYDGVTALGTARVNQELAPNDFTDAGVAWENLGLCKVSSHRLAVELSDAANELVIADAIRIERVEPQPLQVIDDGDLGFTVVSGSWLVNPGGYGNDKHFKAAGTGTAVVRWSFDVEPGLYRVSATWTADRNRATDSPFTVYDGATAVATVDMNQELAPNDFTDAGAAWENVGWLYDIGTGRLVVELSDAANELVVADAIRIERAEPEPLQIVDDGDPGFTVVSGSWLVNPGGYGNDKRFKAAGTGAAVVRWSFDVEPGLYRVSATWTADRNRATDSPFTVYDGATALGTTPVNQEVAPDDFSDAGVMWENLGSSYIVSGTRLVVELSDQANEIVIADAIRIERVASGA